MFSSSPSVTSTIDGGYFLETRLSVVNNKLSEVYKKVKELEFMIFSCMLNPHEITYLPTVAEACESTTSDEAKKEMSEFIQSLISKQSLFFVSIPPGLVGELNQNRDVEHTLRVYRNEICDRLYEQKKKQHSQDAWKYGYAINCLGDAEHV